MNSVAVIGGGWAGCAAAVALAAQGRRVTLYEAAPVLGGRAPHASMRDGLSLDNGQHLLLGAYAATRALVAALHAGGAPLAAVAARDGAAREAAVERVRAARWRWPAPFGLACRPAGGARA